MKIKLNRDLWNHKSGDEIEVGENHGTWAVGKGYATMVEIEPISAIIKPGHKSENKAIQPKYIRNAT